MKYMCAYLKFDSDSSNCAGRKKAQVSNGLNKFHYFFILKIIFLCLYTPKREKTTTQLYNDLWIVKIKINPGHECSQKIFPKSCIKLYLITHFIYIAFAIVVIVSLFHTVNKLSYYIQLIKIDLQPLLKSTKPIFRKIKSHVGLNQLLNRTLLHEFY